MGDEATPAEEEEQVIVGRSNERLAVAPDGFPVRRFLERCMRILVQDRRTNAFLTHDTKWVKQLDYARRFSTSLDALRFCVQRELKGMDLLVCYSGDKNNLRLPLC